MKNLTPQKSTLNLNELIIQLFPVSFTEDWENPFLHVHHFPEIGTLMTESGRTDMYIMPCTELPLLSNTLGRDCVAGAKLSPPQ